MDYAPPPPGFSYAPVDTGVPAQVQISQPGYAQVQTPGMPQEKPTKSHWSGWSGMILAIIAIIFVVLALVLILANNTKTTIFPNMNVIINNGTGSETLTLDGNDVWVNEGGAVNLTLNVPIPGTGYTAGQTFIIDNAKGSGDVTINFAGGVTVYPVQPNVGQPVVVATGTSSQFIWISQTEVHQWWVGP